MYCKYRNCQYQSQSPEDIFRHMIHAHGMSHETTPPELMYLWQNNSAQGFYETPHPVTGIAPIHQQNAQAAETIRLFNPNPNAHIMISPSVTPAPWQKVDENYYVLEEELCNEPLKKIKASGKVTHGHGVLSIHKIESHEKESIINNLLNKGPVVETSEITRTLAEEYKPYTASLEYKRWETDFLNKSATALNLFKSKVIGGDF